MKNRLFFPLLLVCLIFGLTFTSCKEDEEEIVFGLWENIRNTAYSMQNMGVKYTVGFYSPSNGPYNRDPSHPYCVVRKDDSGVYDVRSFSFGINSTGHRITDNGNDIFRISVSGDSITLSDMSGYYGEFSGRYTKFNTDPKYAFNEAMTEFWPQVKNTAWIKTDSSSPSVGFYEFGKGPLASYLGSPASYPRDFGYFYLKMPNGDYFYSTVDGMNGRAFLLLVGLPNESWWFGNSIIITLTNNNNNMAIPSREFGRVGGPTWEEAEPLLARFEKSGTSSYTNFVYVSDTDFNSAFSGSYTKASEPVSWN